jgi:anaerobic magnesium-protoporphyrin IX monomethyl ester cyclase
MYLKAGFDYVIHQNAEKTVVELLTAYKKDSESIKKINGISYLSDGKYIKNDPQKQNYPIENAVMPLWEKINIEPYRKMWKEAHGYFSLNISTSHGCPYSCNWCAKPLYGRTYTSIPAKEAANQFAYLANTLKADHVWVTDDIFALKAGWINEFAQELEQLNVKLPLRCQNRADLITDEFAKNLARAGCVELWLGAESGSQKVLDAMNKRVTIEQIKNATKHLQKYKIKVGFFLQYGYPGEEMEDIEKTFSMIKDALPDYVGVSVSYPLKDTPFYESVKAEMVEKKNWKDSGDLAIMFQGKYHPDFYRALYSYTHHYFGYVSLFKRQPIKQTIKRSIQLLKHIPGMIKYKHLMRSYT